METVKYLILILLINSIVFILLNWTLDFRKNKLIVLGVLACFFLISFTTGKLLQKRYTMPLQIATTFVTKSIEELDRIEKDSVQHFTIGQSDIIEDIRAKNILSQLANECNKDDTISCYLYSGRVNFLNFKIWTHKTGNENRIFLVSLENH